MRPGPRGPGNLFGVEQELDGVEASMRPGPRGPGNLFGVEQELDGVEASMRPGPRGPGNTNPNHAKRSSCLLQ